MAIVTTICSTLTISGHDALLKLLKLFPGSQNKSAPKVESPSKIGISPADWAKWPVFRVHILL